jgi:hypothetical protein
MSFYEFSYISNFRSKSIGVGLWFYRKSPVCEKNVFLSCEAHILDRLYIMVPYMSLYGFKKNQIFAQNQSVLASDFTENR